MKRIATFISILILFGTLSAETARDMIRDSRSKVDFRRACDILIDEDTNMSEVEGSIKNYSGFDDLYVCLMNNFDQGVEVPVVATFDDTFTVVGSMAPIRFIGLHPDFSRIEEGDRVKPEMRINHQSPAFIFSNTVTLEGLDISAVNSNSFNMISTDVFIDNSSITHIIEGKPQIQNGIIINNANWLIINNSILTSPTQVISTVYTNDVNIINSTLNSYSGNKRSALESSTYFCCNKNLNIRNSNLPEDTEIIPFNDSCYKSQVCRGTSQVRKPAERR